MAAPGVGTEAKDAAKRRDGSLWMPVALELVRQHRRARDRVHFAMASERIDGVSGLPSATAAMFQRPAQACRDLEGAEELSAPSPDRTGPSARPLITRDALPCTTAVVDHGFLEASRFFRAIPATDRIVFHFNDALLPLSETFVQQRLLPGRFQSVAASWRRADEGLRVPCPSLLLPARPVIHGDTFAARALRRLMSPGQELRIDADLVALLRRTRPAVVHAHFGPIGIRLRRACRLLGIPLVVSFYGFDIPRDHHSKRHLARHRSLFRTATALTAEGPFMARRLVAFGADPARVKLLPLALPGWATEEPQRQDAHAPSFRMLQVARFVEKKGVDLTVQALARLRAAGVDAHLTLVGDGPQRPLIEEMISSLGVRQHVDLLGYRPHEELVMRFGRAHVLVQPSRFDSSGDSEGGYPTTLVEAQAQALPVAATAHADIPMVIRHGETGLLSPENDVDALAANLERMARNRSLLGPMGDSGRRGALRRHDTRRMLVLRERIYREAIRFARTNIQA